MKDKTKEDTKKIIIYVTIDNDVTYDFDTFFEKLKSVILDEREWSKKEYYFMFVSSTKFSIVPDKPRKPNHYKKLIIRLSQNDTVRDQCSTIYKGKDLRLSCFDPTVCPNEILINEYRWKHGSKESKLSMDDYRTYIVNHEMGHALGRYHSECTCDGCDVPVMVQQTLSIGNCKPNPGPLDNE